MYTLLLFLDKNDSFCPFEIDHSSLYSWEYLSTGPIGPDKSCNFHLIPPLFNLLRRFFTHENLLESSSSTLDTSIYSPVSGRLVSLFALTITTSRGTGDPGGDSSGRRRYSTGDMSLWQIGFVRGKEERWSSERVPDTLERIGPSKVVGTQSGIGLSPTYTVGGEGIPSS